MLRLVNDEERVTIINMTTIGSPSRQEAELIAELTDRAIENGDWDSRPSIWSIFPWGMAAICVPIMAYSIYQMIVIIARNM